ncbi:hypothetical protein RRG08_059335 [Elysia crispata]|uniref:Uncharacterized protein n=1 Tax=Elysia crispata TaxID=231223 RepID=A0AAE1BE10_9GAST|nr:hypothetical protein RRG08_059335 [Elysia crispata]
MSRGAGGYSSGPSGRDQVLFRCAIVTGPKQAWSMLHWMTRTRSNSRDNRARGEREIEGRPPKPISNVNELWILESPVFIMDGKELKRYGKE